MTTKRKRRKKTRKRRRIEYWVTKYQRATAPLSEGGRLFVELFRTSIKEGIERAVERDRFDTLDDLDEILQCYEIEVTLQFLPDILRSYTVMIKEVKAMMDSCTKARDSP